MFAWSHTFYATYTKRGKTTYYNFWQKKDRDEAVRYGFKKVSAQEAYKHYHEMKRVEWRDFDRFIKPSQKRKNGQRDFFIAAWTASHYLKTEACFCATAAAIMHIAIRNASK